MHEKEWHWMEPGESNIPMHDGRKYIQSPCSLEARCEKTYSNTVMPKKTIKTTTLYCFTLIFLGESCCTQYLFFIKRYPTENIFAVRVAGGCPHWIMGTRGRLVIPTNASSSGEFNLPMQRDTAEEPQLRDYSTGAKLQAPLMSIKSDVRQRGDGSSKSDTYLLHRLHQ